MDSFLIFCIYSHYISTHGFGDRVAATLFSLQLIHAHAQHGLACLSRSWWDGREIYCA